MLLKRSFDRSQQCRCVYRFREEIAGPFFHCIDCQPYIALSRNKNDWQSATLAFQSSLKF